MRCRFITLAALTMTGVVLISACKPGPPRALQTLERSVADARGALRAGEDAHATQALDRADGTSELLRGLGSHSPWTTRALEAAGSVAALRGAVKARAIAREIVDDVASRETLENVLHGVLCDTMQYVGTTGAVPTPTELSDFVKRDVVSAAWGVVASKIGASEALDFLGKAGEIDDFVNAQVAELKQEPGSLASARLRFCSPIRALYGG